MNTLVVNKLIEWFYEGAKVSTERVLYVDAQNDIALIDVESPRAWPIWRDYKEVVWALEAGIAKLLEQDTFAPFPLSESELNSERYKLVKAARDRAYSRIATLFEGSSNVQMLDRVERTRLMAHRVKEVKVSRQTLTTDVRRWWQGGQTPNALLGRYYLCGQRKDGEPRKLKEKLGRPSVITRNDEKKRPIGVNIDERWRNIIINGGERFYDNRSKPSWAEAYRATLRYFCRKEIKVDNGIKLIVLPDPNKNEVFTVGQFRYHYLIHLKRNLQRALLKRHGSRKFNLRQRGLQGNAKDQANGPGALYQIDATLADVYLKRRLNPRKIIGRPVIYAVIDVFSRMIVGIAVRPEGEGWQGVRLALDNVVADKVAFCAEYDIPITEELWPRCYLPTHLTGDRGPLVGKNGDNLPKSLNVRVSNTAPYRADWKGCVEQFFNLLNIFLIHALPGAVDPHHERGDKDYRLDAVFDIHEFTELVIYAVLFYNLKRRINDYPLDADMIADEVQPYPLELYYWGIENRSGSLIERDPETVRINLLPEGTATVTEWGIKFGPCLYTCDRAEEEGWREKARNFGRWDMKVAYHPRTTEILYLRPGGGMPSIPCHLTDPVSAYARCDWREVKDYVEEDKVAKAYAEARKMQDLSDLETTVKYKINRALKNKREDLIETKSRSKRSQIQSIRGNRREEIEEMQQAEVSQFLRDRTSGNAGHSSTTQNCEEDDAEPVPMPQLVNLQEVREKKMRNGQN